MEGSSLKRETLYRVSGWVHPPYTRLDEIGDHVESNLRVLQAGGGVSLLVIEGRISTSIGARDGLSLLASVCDWSRSL